MKEKILFFDYDGTLVDEIDGIYEMKENTKNALLTLAQNGHKTFLATGRSRLYVPSDILKYFTGVISCNGAAASIGDVEIYKNNIKGLDLFKMWDFLKENDITCLFEQDDRCFKTPWSETALENGFKVLGVKTTGFETINAITDDFSVCKVILFFTDKEKLSLFLDHYKNKYEMRIGKGGLYVDFNQKGITKGCGVREVIKYYNADVADTFAFGDGENDVEMLSAVNVSVAMGRHSPLLDNISKFVCDTVANDGIVNSLKKFKLI